jgi:hypothetical protein
MCGCQMCDCKPHNVGDATVVVSAVAIVTVVEAGNAVVAVAVHFVAVVVRVAVSYCVTECVHVSVACVAFAVPVSCVAFHHSDGRAHHGWCM